MPYFITNDCIACGDCTVVCPRQAIVEAGRFVPAPQKEKPSPEMARPGMAADRSGRDPAAFYEITAACDNCGCCQGVCPAGAIVWQAPVGGSLV